MDRVTLTRARQDVDKQEPEPGRRKRAARLRCGRAVPLSLAALLTLTACGRAPTDDILPGGIPAMTNLHQASALPPDSVRTVARRDYGWRLIYHPARAPGDAEQRAARALCGLERRPVARIDRIPRLDPYADPGAAIIDITCAQRRS